LNSHYQHIDTVVFDYDGTLMDTNEAVLGSWQYAGRKLLGREFDPGELTATLGEPVSVSAGALFPGVDSRTVIEAYREYQYEHYTGMIRLFPGVKEMLDELKAAGYKLGIVTNRHRPTAEDGLRKFGIEEDFLALVTVGEAPRDKPAPEHIWYTLEKMGSVPERALLVGDSQNDIIGGHRAGLVSVRVGWAVATDDAHGDKAAEPDYVIAHPSELLPLLAELNA
jgi:pyrophosphatase PpaX